MTSNARASSYRAILVLSILCLGLAAFGTVAWLRGQRAPLDATEFARLAANDPELRRQAVEELVKRGGGIWDVFPDPEVGRVLQPGLSGREVGGIKVTSNEMGLRERPFAQRKSAGTTRVVLLGDSFVFGEGVQQDERLGVFLERALAEKAGAAHGPIEVLHFGASGWNILAECAFVRRQMSLLQPDLIVHVVVRNDLDDNYGTRGFGELANFDLKELARGEGIFHQAHASSALRGRLVNWIAAGLDHESRSRYERAEAAIFELATLAGECGGRYLLVDYFAGIPAIARHYLAKRLRPEQQAFLPSDLIEDDRYRIGNGDLHWNRAGHDLMSRLLYELIRARGLLPKLALAEWPEAAALAADWWKRGEREAAPTPDFTQMPPRRSIGATVDFRSLDEEAKAQVHGGIFLGDSGAGVVAPYAATILRCEGRKTLVVSGSQLQRRELDGGSVDVFVDEAKVGSIALRADDSQPAIDARFEVPEAIARRKFVSARFESSSYCFVGEDLRVHAVFRLRRLALE